MNNLKRIFFGLFLVSLFLGIFFYIGTTNKKIVKNNVYDIDVRNGLLSENNENLSVTKTVITNSYIKITFKNNTNSIYHLENCEIEWANLTGLDFGSFSVMESSVEERTNKKVINMDISPQSSKTITIFNDCESYKQQSPVTISYKDYKTGKEYMDIIATDDDVKTFNYPSFLTFLIKYQIWIAVGIGSLIALIILLKVRKRIRRNRRLKKLEELDNEDSVKNNNLSSFESSNNEAFNNDHYYDLEEEYKVRNVKLYKFLGIILFILFFVLMIVQKMGPERPIGSGFIGKINNLVDYKDNHSVDVISDLMLYASFIFVLIAGVIGIMDLLKKKLSRFIVVFGIFTVVALAFWILLDKVMNVTLRPLADENSYPSTHVFVFTFFTLTGVTLLFDRIFKDSSLKGLVYLVAVILAIVVMPMLRVIAGQHYISDTFGGVLLGLSLYFLTIGFGFKHRELINDESKEREINNTEVEEIVNKEETVDANDSNIEEVNEIETEELDNNIEE